MNDNSLIKQRNKCEHCEYHKDLKEYIMCINESVDKDHDMLNCNLYEPKNPKKKKYKKTLKTALGTIEFTTYKTK